MVSLIYKNVTFQNEGSHIYSDRIVLFLSVVCVLVVKNFVDMITNNADFSSLILCLLVYVCISLFLIQVAFLCLSYRRFFLFHGYTYTIITFLFSIEFVNSVYSRFTGEAYCGPEVIEYALSSFFATRNIVLALFKDSNFSAFFVISLAFWVLLFLFGYFMARIFSKRFVLFSKAPAIKKSVAFAFVSCALIFGLAGGARVLGSNPGYLGNLLVDLFERWNQSYFSSRSKSNFGEFIKKPKLTFSHNHLDAVFIKANNERPKKNIVIILLESVGANAVSIYNLNLHTTPTLSALAKKSWIFSNARAIVPVTIKHGSSRY